MATIGSSSCLFRPEDDEDRFGRIEIERQAGQAILLLPGRRKLHTTGLRPPELGPLALYAEAASAGDRCLALVGHEVQLGSVFQRAVDITGLAGKRAVKGEVNRHFPLSQDLFGRFAPDDAALAQRVLLDLLAVAIAPEPIGQLRDFLVARGEILQAR